MTAPAGPVGPALALNARHEGATFRDLVRAFTRIGWLSFGGPTAQIALMHREIVESKRWLDESGFVRALGFCMLLPGPEAMQLATYVGWRVHGTRGGLAAGALFVLPGALVVLALSIVYVTWGEVPLVAAAFLGVQSATLAIVVEAMLRLRRRALVERWHAAVAAAAFVAIFAFAVPFPLIIAVAAMLGLVRPSPVESHTPHVSEPVAWARTARTVVLGLSAWPAPLLLMAVVFGAKHLLVALGWFFSKLAVVTFGGAYAVLTYMAQDVVARHGWLTADQMVAGLGLAETTPGPLILVTEFVGFVAAHRAHPGQAMLMGMLGAAVALWATFVPCFLWIFAGAPYLERLTSMPRLRRALEAVTAAVLGVILNLAVWFGMHVLFARVRRVDAGVVHVSVPEVASLEVGALVLAAGSAVALLGLRWSVPRTLGVAAAGGILVSLLVRY